MKLKRNTISWLLCILGSILCISGYFLFESAKNEESKGQYVAFVLDVSQSMKVEDVEGTSRLQTAKNYITHILQENKGIEASLTVFAGDSLRILPFTHERDLFLNFLQAVDEGNVLKQGTRIDLALEDALANFHEARKGTLVLLSDGGDEKTMLSSGLQKSIKERDLDIYIVGVGTQKGGYIPTGDIFSPYKLYQGRPVVSQLHTSSLQEIASELSGKYLSYREFPQLKISPDNTSGHISLFLLLACAWFSLFVVLYYREFYK